MSVFNDPNINEEFNDAVIDSLIFLGDHLNSTVLASKVSFTRTYSIDNEDFKISCHGGCREGMHVIEMFVFQNFQKIEELSFFIETRDVDGGIGLLIKNKYDKMLGKSDSIPEYVVEHLNKGYSRVKCVSVYV